MPTNIQRNVFDFSVAFAEYLSDLKDFTDLIRLDTMVMDLINPSMPIDGDFSYYLHMTDEVPDTNEFIDKCNTAVAGKTSYRINLRKLFVKNSINPTVKLVAQELDPFKFTFWAKKTGDVPAVLRVTFVGSYRPNPVHLFAEHSVDVNYLQTAINDSQLFPKTRAQKALQEQNDFNANYLNNASSAIATNTAILVRAVQVLETVAAQVSANGNNEAAHLVNLRAVALANAVEHPQQP